MKQEGIIIKNIAYKETSKIVYLYTSQGKISIKAIGAKKNKNNTFGFGEIGNIVSFVSTDSNFPSLNEYEIIYSAYNLTKSYDSIYALSKIIELINYLPDDSIHQRIYPFVKNIILNLDKYPLKALSIFLIKMTYNFGIAPKLDSCIIYNNKNLIDFSITRGGALCNNHSSNEINNLKIWTEYYKEKKEIESYTDSDFNKLLNEINEFYLLHANINLKLKGH